MVILFSITCIGLGVCFYRGKYPLASPAFLYCVFWMVLGILSSLGLYGYYHISTETIIILLLGVVFFCLGFLIKKIERKKNSRYAQLDKINNKRYSYMLVVAILIQSVFFIRSVLLIFSGIGNSDVRWAFGDVGLGIFNNAIESLSYALFVKPMLFVCLSQLVIGLVYKKTISKRNLILSIIFILLFSIDFGRVNLLYFFIMIVLAYYIKIKRENKKVNIDKIFKSIMLLVVILIVYDTVSSLRGIDTGIIKSLYEYLVTGIIQLEHRIEYFRDSHSNYTYGFSFFSGVLNVLFIVIDNLGISIPNAWNNYLDLSKYIQQFIPIAPTISSNAFVTLYYYFYIDFSYIGICLGSIIYGYICKLSFRKIEINSMYYLSSYLIIMIGVLTSFIRWQFSQQGYVLSFVYLYLIYAKIRIKK